MNKVTELLDAVGGVITCVRNLADSLQVVADVLTDMKSVEAIDAQPVAQVPEKESKPKKEKAKVYTLEDVRGVLAEKSQNGLTSYVLDTLKDFHEEYIWDKPVKNFIQLKYNKMMEMPKYDSSDAYKKRYIEGAIKDPVVELLIIPTIEDVKFDGDFDYVVMAQSPNYTPASADFILDIFREYIEEI